MNLIFGDFEVYRYDWLCVFMDVMNREEIVIVNDVDKLRKFYNEHKNDIYVFFNGRQYDQYIMKSLLCGLDPKACNDYIIVEKRKGWEFSDLFKMVNINIFDVMTTFHGLKTLEGFMGNNIEETGVDFNIDRKLTAAEIAETIKYCRHDVEQTIEVFLRRKEEFDAHIGMLKAFGLPMSFVSKTKVQLSAAALGAIKRERNDEFDLTFPHTMQIKRYMDIPLWYLNPDNRYERDEDGNVVEKKSYDTVVAGVPHTFAWGGLHGARENYIEEGQFLNVDVASYYPSLMIEYGFLSRNVSDPKKYTEIYKQRLKYKAEKNPLQAPLKIVLNGTYGAMKDRYNPLYDPRQANNVCVGGQLLLLDLIEKLEDYCDIIQSNTDGILVKLRDNREQVESICREWMQRTRMVLEFDEYVKVIQRDVNNYIIVAADGSYKSKGSVVKKNHELDNDTTILNEAVINYFVKGMPVELTINGCTDLIKFQRIVKVSSKYDYACHGFTVRNYKQYEEMVRQIPLRRKEYPYDNEAQFNHYRVPDMMAEAKSVLKYEYTPLHGKTFRVFASTRPTDGGIFKVKKGKNPEKFANTPEHCFIMNGNINGVSIPDKLDRQFYIDMANRHVQQFLGTLKKGK